MSWQGIEGHDALVEQFRRSLARGRLASTFLFVGPEGVGKRAFAEKLAQSLLCERVPPERLDPCGTCPSCQQVLAGTHPDLIVVCKPADKNEIPLDLLIGRRERRMQEGLCHDLSLRPLMGRRKVAIIDDADTLNDDGANALLKTLEEPPPTALMILIGTSPDRQLPTIRSRSQIIRFEPLEPSVVERLLIEQNITDDAGLAKRLAEHSDGSLARAAELADAELWTFCDELLGRLAASPLESVATATTLLAFVDAAGKEAVRRRRRAKQILLFAAEFYRQVLRALEGCEPTGDAPLRSAVAQAVPHLSPESAAAAVERSLETIGQIDRYANQATALECWLDDLARLADHEVV